LFAADERVIFLAENALHPVTSEILHALIEANL
jgi:hypothetical protein